ncbi:MAG: NAD-dependent epimerase/dehydratase family protein [Deltaproteobacteria bacterium]
MKQRSGNVLVTGATGFVGRFLCERLLSQGSRARYRGLSSDFSR